MVTAQVAALGDVDGSGRLGEPDVAQLGPGLDQDVLGAAFIMYAVVSCAALARSEPAGRSTRRGSLPGSLTDSWRSPIGGRHLQDDLVLRAGVQTVDPIG